MFLATTLQRNPALVRAAVALHQRRQVPPNTFLVDLEALRHNAGLLAEAAERHGLRLYGMTKQFGRNPLLAHAMLAGGIGSAVAVDWDEAHTLARFGVPIGHLGHLVQVPDAAIPMALSVRPQVITVFSLDKARRVAEAATVLGREQSLLLRVIGSGDVFHPSQEGGFPLEELRQAARAIVALAGVRVAGVTSFPCLTYDEATAAAIPTPNLATLRRAAELLRDVLGEPIEQLNAPGLTTSATIPLLAALGATHGEPGSSLVGHTPLHAAGDQPERPALVYVSEVSHRLGERLFCYGGGLYPRGRLRAAVVARDPDQAVRNAPLAALPRPPDAIDYHGELRALDGGDERVGDTAVYAFRSQVFVGRGRVAVLGGVAAGRPHILGLFDALGQPLDPRGLAPLSPGAAHRSVERACRAAGLFEVPSPVGARSTPGQDRADHC